LEVYKYRTLACKGRYLTAEIILLIIEFLLKIFEDSRHKYVSNPFLSPCCQAGYNKLEKYYNKTGELYTYITAVVLVPTCK
jgi:hypothetical protein